MPNFIVQLDDGRGSDDPLNLIIEIKGMKNEQMKLKKETMTEKWVPGVNALEIYGRWAFEQFDSVFEIDKEFKALIDRLLSERKAL